MRVAPEIILTEDERAELMKLVNSKRTSIRLEQRAGIVLLAADGVQNKEIAEVLGVGRVQGGGVSAMLRIDWPASSVTFLVERRQQRLMLRA